MASDPDKKRPIIVKKQAGHHDDHGGQWKVAYADFVTAMMAFFLIMWLLASSTSNEREVIAKYFSSTSLFDLPSGNGVLNGGRSVMEGTDSRPYRGAPSNRDAKVGAEKDKDAKAAEPAAAARERAERQRFEALKAEIERLMADGALKSAASNVDIAMTADGLRIQIFDRDGQPMFAPGASDPLPRLRQILDVIGEVLSTVRNNVILSGHTDAQPMPRDSYSNWELSADRANAVRRTLESGSLARGRIIRVEGRAAVDPLLPEAPLDPRNRRIAITILRGDIDAKMHSTR
jgi:chemotaxis protein MotB